MPFDAPFRELVAANAPLWAGEAEIIRTYWDWPERSRESDLLWLARQCHKEFWGGGDAQRRGLFAWPLAELSAAFDKIDRGVPRREVLAMAALLHEEFAHYCVLADVYDLLKTADEPGLDPHGIKHRSWPENDDLRALRTAQREQHGEIGRRAHLFTEDGYCALFREGMKLGGRGGVDDAIAAACAEIHDEEFDHMMSGVAGLASGAISADDLSLLAELTTAQMCQRIHMRNGQFGYPVGEARLAEILAGDIEPVAFDYEKAETLLQ